MKQVYTKNNKLVVEHTFYSLSEYCEYLKNGVINPKITSSTSSKTGDINFSGTATYEEAINLCLYGDYSNKFDELLKLKDKLDDELTNKKKVSTQTISHVGYIPHVPNFIKGIPLNMINTIYTEFKDTSYITIYFNVSQLSTYSKEQFYHKGVICLSLIEHFEQMGYQVILKLFAGSYCKDQVILTFFELKDSNERLSLRNLFFPMTNVAFLRRLHFRLREITSELESYWSDIYGYSLKSEEIKSYLDINNTTIILSYPDELGILGKNLTEDAINCFKKLGLEGLL
ncbi:MAG: hypothetical protein LBV51_04290 [Acholeplasmatales bacterium]|jgi:hypothetical protein|nr:hypothetical protein [Acholeplasmatales bacterium]